MLYSVHHRLADEKRTILRMFCPPVYQSLIISTRMTDFPIYLRNIIIDPAFACPQQDISIQIIIILQTICLTPQRISAFITINAERTDPELYPRFYFTHSLMYLFDKDVHIAATPVGFVRKTSSVTGETVIIGEIFPGNRIRIEVIVHMDGIHIITGNDIGNHHANMLTTFR